MGRLGPGDERQAWKSLIDTFDGFWVDGASPDLALS